jgi:CRISPR-associated protein Csb2
MPIGELDKGREKTTLVFDTWADIGEGTLAVRWGCALDGESSALLDTLASHLCYVGRSESWVLAEAMADDAELPPGIDAYPHVDDRPAESGWEQVSLLAAEPPQTYLEWRERSVAKAREGLPLPEGKKKPPKKLLMARDKAVAPYPKDVIDCIQKDTSWWKGHGWSQPPGSRRVLYWRRSDALSVGPPAPAVRRVPATVTTMLLALTTPSGNRSALPPCTRTLPQAELIHRALVGKTGGGRRIDCPELTGKDARNKPLTGHQHAHILPLDLDGDDHIDHVVIHAPMGLGPAAQAAIRGLRRTWTKGGVGELQLALAGQGDLDDLRKLPSPLHEGIETVLGPREGARVWTSLTPIVLPRHPKRRGANTLDGQILSELSSRDLPSAKVEVLLWDTETNKLRHYVRVRRHPAPQPPTDAGFVVRLTFERPVPGPLALGYASHFGLGLFVPEPTT